MSKKFDLGWCKHSPEEKIEINGVETYRDFFEEPLREVDLKIISDMRVKTNYSVVVLPEKADEPPKRKFKIYNNDYGVFQRITFDSVMMRLASSLALRSTCLRRKVGVVFTDPFGLSVPCFGYNGDEKGGGTQCDSIEPGACGCTQAEINALSKSTGPVVGGTCYVTLAPCKSCARVLINREIKRVVYLNDYRNQDGIILLINRGIEVIKYDQLPDIEAK